MRFSGSFAWADGKFRHHIPKEKPMDRDINEWARNKIAEVFRAAYDRCLAELLVARGMLS
jgi:hypothetical protein